MIRIMDRVGYIILGLKRNWLSGFSLFLVAYFTFHAFQGDNSIHALRALQQQKTELSAQAASIRADHDYMVLKTVALSRKAIDPDMLEEQVRNRLGFAHPDEVIILLD